MYLLASESDPSGAEESKSATAAGDVLKLKLKCAALLSLSYISLCLQHPIDVLDTAKQLLGKACPVFAFLCTLCLY